MRYNQLIDIIQEQRKFRPSQQQIADILGLRQSAIGNRAIRNSEFSIEEIKKIEENYGLDIIANTECVNINYYEDVYGSCGTGLTVFSESNVKKSVPKDMIIDYSDNKRYSLINSRGDSMNPSICDNDKLIVEHWNGDQIIDNRVYVFKYNEELFIKRLVKNITQIVIKSDNPEYDSIKIDGNDEKFVLLGRIVGLFREKV